MFILARQSKTDAKKCDRITIGAILWLDDDKTVTCSSVELPRGTACGCDRERQTARAPFRLHPLDIL